MRASIEDPGSLDLYGQEDLHLTLVFVGEISREQVALMRQAAQWEFQGLCAPELVLLGNGGAFPGGSRARSIWRGVLEQPGSEGRLAAIRNRALQIALSVGWRAGRTEWEKPFHPHVTVARPMGAEIFEGEVPRLGRDRPWLAPEVSLFASCPEAEREAGASRYRVLASWNLAVQPDG